MPATATQSLSECDACLRQAPTKPADQRRSTGSALEPQSAEDADGSISRSENVEQKLLWSRFESMQRARIATVKGRKLVRDGERAGSVVVQGVVVGRWQEGGRRSAGPRSD